ncbi:MAG: dethiobiotin synthase [Nitrospirae bacterium GWC2_56_14]|nr:MAG: dethiobiotin synthase [Nitrospirae bacterium GWC2_56_14]
MIKGLFITGTDTGVGKTYVAAGIAKALRSAKIDVGVMKPVETGCRPRSGKLIPRDAEALIRAAAVRDPLSLVNPYRFQAPVAPSVAAQIERKTINPGKILRSFKTLSQRHRFMIVEGAGGIMVPLAQGYLFLDLAEALGLPVLIVARPGLGTINHTLLTIDALRSRRMMIAGIVINDGQGGQQGLAEATSPAVIEELSGVPIIGTIGHRSRAFGELVEHLKIQVNRLKVED